MKVKDLIGELQKLPDDSCVCVIGDDGLETPYVLILDFCDRVTITARPEMTDYTLGYDEGSLDGACDEAADAQRKSATIACALCGRSDDDCTACMSWYRREGTVAIYCGACVYHMLSAPQYAEMRVCDALAQMRLRLLDPDEEFGGVYSVNGNTTEWGDRFDENLRSLYTVTSNLEDD